MQNSVKPDFSIVTACKDGLFYLKKTVPTIINQTFTNWEWLFLDDASIEPIEDYIKSLNDPRIIYLRNKTALGQTRTLNAGIRRAQSDWIVRMDADDLASLNKLELTFAQIQKFKKNFHPFIFSDFNIIDEKDKFISRIRFRHPLNPQFYQYLLKNNNPISHPTVVFYKYNPKNKLYQYNENLRNAQDYELWKRILTDYPQEGFAHIPEPTISYRLVQNSLSGAGAAEQKSELHQIRSQTNIWKSAKAQTTKPLTSSEQMGMQAFRILFFKFVGQSSNNDFYKLNDIRLTLEMLKYPNMIPKGLIYLFCRPFKKLLKKTLFQSIYQ